MAVQEGLHTHDPGLKQAVCGGYPGLAILGYRMVCALARKTPMLAPYMGWMAFEEMG
jgi:hypothetical protein